MPQATEELRNKMKQRFSTIDDYPPGDFLLSRGYKIYSGVITPPKDKVVQADEIECIDFLVQEWDYAFEPAA